MNSVAISCSQATNLFGSIEVVGRSIPGLERGEPYSLRLSGVFEDLPPNSQMNFSKVRRITEQEKRECGWTCINGNVYLKVRPGADGDQPAAARLGTARHSSAKGRRSAGERG
jgi:hypothetical protein